jgi:hypothetical protein
VTRHAIRLAALIIPLATGLGGCSYDYLQHTDRVAYSAGDAVAANLESETINPSRRSIYRTGGLGRNGAVATAATATAAAASGPTGQAGAAPPPAPAAQ